MPKKLTQEEFIKKAVAVHGDKYDYQRVVYTGYNKKIKIFCNKCKKYFFQTPYSHLLGLTGCPICSSRKRSSTEKFIEKAKIIHKNRYNYDKVKYIDNRTEVKIFCNNCKKYFMQRPCNHLNGHGCKNCFYTNSSKTAIDFIQQAKQIHGDKYDYNKVNYINTYKKVKIYCKKCKNYFFQTPKGHLLGRGCATCSAIQRKISNRMSQEEFLTRVKKIHGEKYSYDKTIYTGLNRKITIFCKKCNQYFDQLARSHLCGVGCGKCARSKGEEFIKQLLINNDIKFETQKRFKDCKDKNPLPFDFYLPKHNICIEFQGEQHFKMKFFRLLNKSWLKGLMIFLKQKKHDGIKYRYCKRNNKQLIKFTYKTNKEIIKNYIRNLKRR